MNVHLSYKPPSAWRIIFRSGVYPRQFSCLEMFRSLVVPGGGFCKGVIIQVIITPTVVLTNGQSCLRRKGGVTGASVNALRQRNSLYEQTSRRSIYETRRPKHPHSPIRRYERRPLGTLSSSPLQVATLCFFHLRPSAKITNFK